RLGTVGLDHLEPRRVHLQKRSIVGNLLDALGSGADDSLQPALSVLQGPFRVFAIRQVQYERYTVIRLALKNHTTDKDRHPVAVLADVLFLEGFALPLLAQLLQSLVVERTVLYGRHCSPRNESSLQVVAS